MSTWVERNEEGRDDDDDALSKEKLIPIFDIRMIMIMSTCKWDAIGNFSMKLVLLYLRYFDF